MKRNNIVPVFEWYDLIPVGAVGQPGLVGVCQINPVRPEVPDAGVEGATINKLEKQTRKPDYAITRQC